VKKNCEVGKAGCMICKSIGSKYLIDIKYNICDECFRDPYERKEIYLQKSIREKEYLRQKPF